MNNKHWKLNIENISNWTVLFNLEHNIYNDLELVLRVVSFFEWKYEKHC